MTAMMPVGSSIESSRVTTRSTIFLMIQSLAVVSSVSHRLHSWPWMNSQTAAMPRSCTSLMNAHAPVELVERPADLRDALGADVLAELRPEGLGR